MTRLWKRLGLAAGLVMTLAAPAAAVQVGEVAPAFELPRLDGKGRLYSAQRSKRVQLVVFWAAECGSCRVEAPRLQALWKQLAGKPVDVVAIHVYDDPAVAKQFLRQNRLGYPVALDEDLLVADAFAIQGTPAVYLVDPQGVVRYHHFLLPSMAQIQQAMKPLPTPRPTPTALPQASPKVQPTPTPVPTPEATPEPEPTPEDSPTPEPTETPKVFQ